MKATNSLNGGESGIRTHDTFNSIHAFQACAENLAVCSTISFYCESYTNRESASNGLFHKIYLKESNESPQLGL